MRAPLKNSPFLSLAAAIVLAPALVGLYAAEPPRPAALAPVDGRLQQIAAFPTREDGIDRPGALVWSERLGSLVLTDAERPGVQRRFHADDGEQRRVTARVPAPATAPEGVDALSGHELKGAARHPETGHLFTYDATDRRLVELDGDRVVTGYDASDIEVADVRSVVLAPSVDPTDHPSVVSVYLLDGGGEDTLGQVVEATFATDLALAAAVAPTSVRVVETSDFDPPSPDPSGLAYLPGADRLVISDGEVNEMAIFEGVNLFTTTRAGAVTATGVSQPWSDEPVGVGYNPTNNHLFVSDDDEKMVFELTAGADGRFGTSDDTRTSFETPPHGATDPEGIDYDPETNSLWIAGGEAADFHRVQAGGDGRFGTGDDVWTNFDAGLYGMRDPEGLGFDTVRGTVVIVDDSSDTIYELDRSGALLNTIDVSSADMRAAAGLAVAPASNGSGARTYYVVARGQDNDSNPSENDGRLYEITASLPPVDGGPGNQPPSVDAGADTSVVLPASASLDGTVSDDGQPDPPGAVTTTWAQVSGPGTATFADAGSVDTTATFDTAGTYVLQLSATDGQLTTADQVTVSVSPAGGANVVEARVSAGTDDVEESVRSGNTLTSSSDLELTTDGNTPQVIGLRFPGLQLPRGARIVSASVQFWTDEATTGATSLTIRAEASDDAPPYAATSGNVTGRATTGTSVAWSPPGWSTVGQAGAAQRTPDLSGVLQPVVDRAGWAPGNALALQVSGTGERTARAFESGAGTAPLLRVEYTGGGGGGPTNQAPAVDAGEDATVQLPATATLDGTVSDDGLPAGSTLTTTWSEVSGPGTVTFGDPAAVDTTASFSQPGTYVLRLTADDGELTATDDVTVTVEAAGPGNQPPSVNAGADATVQLPSTATLDGTVSDDGLPAGSTLTTTWSEVSGPGTVTFGDPAAVDTTASFSQPGTYVLRLTADDGELTATDDVTVQVEPADGGGGGGTTVEVRVRAGSDDAEQAVTGSTSLGSSDLELTTDGSRQQVVGLRFAGLTVPAGATVTSAYVQFRTDEVSTGASSLTIRAEAADNASTYRSATNDITSRATGAAAVSWSPPGWSTTGETGPAQRTPDLSSVVQQVVSRPGWIAGNALALQISGTGRRTAEAYEGGVASAALLHVEYVGGAGGPVNRAPTVDAGPNLTVTFPETAALDGTVTDDGLPAAGTLTTTWTEVSGPGEVTFGSATSPSTTATFSAPGAYTLRLAASDGQLTAQDDVSVFVQDPGGGGAQEADIRVAAGSDDVEESVRSGNTLTSSSDLELTTDGNTQQVVGIRFRNVPVPSGATITAAHLQLTTDEVGSGATALTIRAEALDDPPTYSGTRNAVTSRATTQASVAWAPPAWPTVGEAGSAQRSPDLTALVQEVVDRGGWGPGSALAFQVSGTGVRKARSFESGSAVAPLLHLEWTTG